MTRREILLASGALLASNHALAQSQTALRGLWRDDIGHLGIGAFPEFGPGLYAFDYSGSRIGPLRGVGAQTWEMSGALDGNAPAVATLSVDGGALRLGARRLAPVAIVRKAFTVQAAGNRIVAEIARVAAARPRGAVVQAGVSRLRMVGPGRRYHTFPGGWVLAVTRRHVHGGRGNRPRSRCLRRCRA